MSAALPTDPRRVEIRCEDCARDLGRSAPTLVVALYVTGNWARPSDLRDHWELISLGERRPTRAANAPAPPDSFRVIGTTADGGQVSAATTIGGRTFDQHHPRGRAVELACRRCKRSGWRRRQKLYAVAEQARAAGTSDGYLSLR
jgi:hypothetical protein